MRDPGTDHGLVLQLSVTREEQARVAAAHAVGDFARRSKSDTPDRLITVMPTRANKHGSEDRSTEVPRRTQDELQANSRLVNTQDCTPATQW